MMNDSVLIKVDIDGVLRNWEKSLFDTYKKYYPNDRVILPCTTWDVDGNFPDYKGKFSKFWKELYTKEIYENAELFSGAMKFILDLLDNFPDVWLVTSQPDTAMAPTVHWVQKNLFPQFTPIVFTQDKFDVGRKRYDNRILIDDNMDNLLSEYDAGGTPICFAQRYNEGLDVKIPRFSAANYDTERQFQMILAYLKDDLLIP